MSRFLTDEQSMLRDVARQFARKEVEPLAQAIDVDDRVPETLIKACAALDFFRLYTPEEYGGSGKSLTNACLVLEEIAKASPALAGLLGVQIVLCPGAVEAAGTHEQKQRFLPPSASGDELLAWSMTEPSGAANVAAFQTRLVADGDGYRLDGLKLFTTKGNAKRILVFARTSRGDQQGLGCAIVDADQPGVDLAPSEPRLGWRGTNTGPTAYNNVYVPAGNILGELLNAHASLGPVNQASFISHSVTSLGCVEGLLEKTLEYVGDRTLYTMPMARLQPVSYWVGEVCAKIEASRSLIYDAARLFDEGRPDPVLGSICKAYVCDTMFDCSSKLLQLWGGSGIMNATGVNRYFRDARTNMVAEASSEIHYDIVSAARMGTLPALAAGFGAGSEA